MGTERSDRQDAQGTRQDAQGVRQDDHESRITSGAAQGQRNEDAQLLAAKELVKEARRSKLRRYLFVTWVVVFSLGVGYSVRTNRENINELRETKASNADLRKQVNDLGKASCFGGRVSVRKYNDLVQSIIEGRLDQRQAALQRGDLAAAKLHTVAIARYKKDFLPVSTDAQCNKPIIKPRINRPG